MCLDDVLEPADPQCSDICSLRRLIFSAAVELTSLVPTAKALRFRPPAPGGPTLPQPDGVRPGSPHKTRGASFLVEDPDRNTIKKLSPKAVALVFGLWRVCFPPYLVRPGRRLPVQGLSEGSLGCRMRPNLFGLRLTYSARYHSHQADTHNRSPSPRPSTLYHSRCAQPPLPTFSFACCAPPACDLSDLMPALSLSPKLWSLKRSLRDLGIPRSPTGSIYPTGTRFHIPDLSLISGSLELQPGPGAPSRG